MGLEEQSPFLAIKSLELQLIGILSAIDIYAVSASEQKTVALLKRELTDARLDVRDYELSETRVEQLGKAQEARQRLNHVRRLILSASEFDIFGPVDVAQLTAQVELIDSRLI